MNKKTKWGIIIIIGAGIIGGGIYSQMPKQNEELAAAEKIMANRDSGKKKILNVNAKVIKTKLLTDEFKVVASVLPDEEVDLSFETSGKVIEINFEEGTFVKKGQLLAKVNDRQLQAQLQRLVSQLKLAEDRVFRQDALLKRDAVSKEAYEQVKTDLAILNADIDIVKAEIELTELRAPFDGIIGLRQISVGTYASPTTVVAKLTKTSPLKIQFSVTENNIKDIKKGTNLTFKVSGEQNQFKAQVYAIEPGLDDLHTATARAYYPNRNFELAPGRYASVTLKKQEKPDAIAIPTEAIKPEMGKDFVYLYKGGKAQPVEVTTGSIRTDAEVEIIKGLQVGDTLITSGIMQLRTGLPVILDNVD